MSTDQGDTEVHAGLVLGSPAAFMAAAHELKAPLALVRQLSLTLEQEDDLTPAEIARMLRQITLTSERGLRLTGDLTRAHRQTDLFEMEPINVWQLCEEVAHEMTPLFTAHNKVIRVPVRKQQLLAVANRDLLRRILLGFSDNALHYGGNNQTVELKINARVRDNKVRVGVRDYGPAISPNTWRDLKARLEALAPQPIHARPQSSGLGLSIAGQFAQMMNSQIGASRHRDGATFYIDTPASYQTSLL